MSGRRMVITGGSRGIGFAIARAALAQGASLALLDLVREPLEEAASALRSEFGDGEILTALCDVSSYEQVVAARSELAGTWGHEADCLVNNAGIVRTAAADVMSVGDWDEVLRVNLSGAFYCSQVFGRAMVSARSGTIVSIASMSGLIVNKPQPQISYNVSKAGVIAMTKSLAAEWAPHGVRVNAVAPGYTSTSITEQFLASDTSHYYWDHWMGGTPMGRMALPEEIANVVLFLASGMSSYVTGETVVVDGGYTLW